jgi:hypothetical protein
LVFISFWYGYQKGKRFMILVTKRPARVLSWIITHYKYPVIKPLIQAQISVGNNTYEFVCSIKISPYFLWFLSYKYVLCQMLKPNSIRIMH